MTLPAALCRRIVDGFISELAYLIREFCPSLLVDLQGGAQFALRPKVPVFIPNQLGFSVQRKGSCVLPRIGADSPTLY